MWKHTSATSWQKGEITGFQFKGKKNTQEVGQKAVSAVSLTQRRKMSSEWVSVCVSKCAHPKLGPVCTQAWFIGPDSKVPTSMLCVWTWISIKRLPHSTVFPAPKQNLLTCRWHSMNNTVQPHRNLFNSPYRCPSFKCYDPMTNKKPSVIWPSINHLLFLDNIRTFHKGHFWFTKKKKKSLCWYEIQMRDFNTSL